MYAKLHYDQGPNELRSNWAHDKKSLVAEMRWRRAKKWKSNDIAYDRGRAYELRVSQIAHDRLVDMWRSVKQVDGGVQEMARANRLAWEADAEERRRKRGAKEEKDDRGWHKGASQAIVQQILEQMRAAGVAESGPMWIAIDRAAARACQRWRDRVTVYGWTRPILDRDVVTTIRLPFGEHYGASPGRFTDTGWHDRALLEEFEVIGAGDEPALCAYAECALLSTGWAIRFVAAGPAPERKKAIAPPY